MMGITVYKIDFTQQVAFVFFISVTLFLKNIVLNKNVYMEKIPQDELKLHPHAKPKGLQSALIESCSNVGDIVLDPAAGSFSVFECCKKLQRDFIGSNLRV